MIDAPVFLLALTPALDGALTGAATAALDPSLTLALTGLAGTTLVVFALLRGWQDWLELKRRELETFNSGRNTAEPGQPGMGAARIELADLKERIKKLEAIASGVEL